MVALLGIIHWIWHHSSDWLKRTREYPDPDPVLATVLLLKDYSRLMCRISTVLLDVPTAHTRPSSNADDAGLDWVELNEIRPHVDEELGRGARRWIDR
jgi:hypothetical protein